MTQMRSLLVVVAALCCLALVTVVSGASVDPRALLVQHEVESRATLAELDPQEAQALHGLMQEWPETDMMPLLSEEDMPLHQALLETQAKADSETETETETEAAVETQTEAQADAEAEAIQSEVDATLAHYPAMVEMASDADVEAEAETETETEVEAEGETEVEAEADADAEVEDQVLLESASDVEAEMTVEVDTSAQAQAEQAAQIQNEVDAMLDLGSEADAESDAEAEADADADSEADSEDHNAAMDTLNAVTQSEDYPAMLETQSETESEADVEAQSVADAAAQLDSEFEAAEPSLLETMLGFQAMLETRSDADVDTEAEAEVDAEVDAEAETDAEAEAETDAETEVDADESVFLEEFASLLDEPIMEAGVVWSDRPIDITKHSASEESPVMGAAPSNMHIVVPQGTLSSKPVFSPKFLASRSAGVLQANSDEAGHSFIGVTATMLGGVQGACGSGFSSHIVPDYNMKPACELHDKCYDTCGQTHVGCDTNFLNTMLKICTSKYPAATHRIKYTFCVGQAKLYHAAVARLGGTPFANAQAKCAKKVAVKSAVKRVVRKLKL